MYAALNRRWLRLGNLMGAVLALLLFAGAGSSRQLAEQARQKGKQKAKAEIKLKESEALKEAYILMAGANHDYDGQRAKAMHQVAEAIKSLDTSILKNGSNGEKVVALEEEITAARAKFAAKRSVPVHEVQQLSDLQMREAHRLLVEVHSAMAQRNQPKVREHVDTAVKHVETALKIR
jgi:hypothetical protein